VRGTLTEGAEVYGVFFKQIGPVPVCSHRTNTFGIQGSE